MTDYSFIVKNSLTVNTYFTANSTSLNYYSINTTSSGVSISNTNILIGNSSVNSNINATSYSGTSNNTNYVGSIASANVVSNTQLQSNLANYVPKIGNSTITGNTIFTGTIRAGNTSYIPPGIVGTSNNSIGVEGTSNTYYGVFGQSNVSYGGYFNSNTAPGVYGSSISGIGGSFYSSSGIGIYTKSSSGYAAVFANNTTNIASIDNAGNLVAYNIKSNSGGFTFPDNSTQTTAITYTPVQQGGGTGQGTNKVYLGWLGSNFGIQVDTTDYGATWPINISGNANYAYGNVPNDVGNNGIGSIMLKYIPTGGPSCTAGGTLAGSSIRNVFFQPGGTANFSGTPPGTWRNIGGIDMTSDRCATFQRIA